jgi:hypothetical protein
LTAAAVAAPLVIGTAVGVPAAAVVDAASASAAPIGGAAPAWHILVYTVNDSSSDLPLGFDLDEMVTASRSGIDFTVYIDSSEATMSTSQYVPNTGGAVVVEISDGAATVTDELGELDSGSPDTLGWFVATGLQRHPTERSALVVWDHGLAWQGIAFDQDVTATGDTRRVSYLDASELSRAMDAGLTAAGRDQFDMLILDACLMANLEIASEVAGEASYLISSEELVPGLGLDYDAFAAFATNPAADATTLFSALADGFMRDIEAQAPSQADMMTLSLVDLSQVAALEQAVTGFSQAAAADVVTNATPYLSAAGSGFQYGISGGDWAGYLDLGEFLHGLGDQAPAVATARDTLLAALDQAVLAQVGSPSYSGATGLTVYFPTEPHMFDPDYELLPSAQLWRPFLSAFYDAQANVVVSTDIGFTAENLTLSQRQDGWFTIDAPVTANFSGSIELLAAIPDAEGNLTYFETDAGQLVDGRATVTFLPTLTTVSDGTNSGVPFTTYADGHGYSQFTLQRADGSIANLNWDRAADASTGPFTIIDPTGVLVGYTPQPGDLAYPIVMIQRPGAAPVREATAPALDLNQPWTVTDQPLPAGQQVYVELQITDAAGTLVDSLAGYLTVPR